MVVVTSLGPPPDGIKHVQPGTFVFINRKPLGRGTLHISEARVTWVGDIGHVFSLEYPHIAMHAVSRDVDLFPYSECLYLMIDVRLVNSDSSMTPDSSDADGEDEDNADSDGGITEIRYVPEDKSKLEDMFKAMTECQVLHPDEISSDDEEFEAENEDDEPQDEVEGEPHREDAEDDEVHRGNEPMDQ